jgi:C4-dicarboxylate transporter DctM subunit
VAVQLGIDPVHFGIIMIVNLALGMCTPPMGVNLFISAQLAKVRLDQITLGILPYYAALLITLMLITYVPQLSIGLVQLLK